MIVIYKRLFSLFLFHQLNSVSGNMALDPVLT